MVESFFTLSEVAEIMKVPERTIRRLVEAGKLKAIKIGRESRITARAIEEFARNAENSYEDDLAAPVIGKYQPLCDGLRKDGSNSIKLTFKKIEEILGFDLPSSARDHDAWWHQENNPRGQKLAWDRAGYVVKGYDRKEEWVLFRKNTQVQTGELPPLEADFYEAMLNIYETAGQRHGYWATRFLQMLRRHGGVVTARKLLAKPGGSAGFAKLKDLKELGLTIEALVLKPKYRSLFLDEERELCRGRLTNSGYDISYGEGNREG